MMRYRVAHDYRSARNDSRTRTILRTGEIVDLQPENADWLNRDSPGVLEPVEPHRVHASATASWAVEAVEDR